MTTALVDFHEGQRVRVGVVPCALSGEDVIEGWATIRKIHQGDRQGVHADVEFDNEPGRTRPRWVFAKDQEEQGEVKK